MARSSLLLIAVNLLLLTTGQRLSTPEPEPEAQSTSSSWPSWSSWPARSRSPSTPWPHGSSWPSWSSWPSRSSSTPGPHGSTWPSWSSWPSRSSSTPWPHGSSWPSWSSWPSRSSSTPGPHGSTWPSWSSWPSRSSTNSPWPTQQPTNSSRCPRNQVLFATSSHRMIESPNYPNSYDNNVNCSWQIVAPLQSSLRITVMNYAIERHTLCLFDALEIFSGSNRNGLRLEKLCGQGSYILRDYQLARAFVNFHTDGSVRLQGFRLTYWSVPMDSEGSGEGGGSGQEESSACNGQSLVLQASSVAQFVESPGYPVSYSNHLNCSWRIQAPADVIVDIIIMDIDLEHHFSCNYDALDIYDGTRQRIAKICGRQTSSTSYSVSGGALVHFHTDLSITDRGFKLSYKTMDRAQPCQGGLLVLQASRSPETIESPNYPMNYPNHANCKWRIEAPDKLIKITIENLRLESHASCYFDALEIFDGPGQTALRLAKLCGQHSSSLVYASSAPVMYIRFHTDYSVTYTGFRLSYSLVDEFYPACHGGVPQTLDATFEPQSIQSPGYLEDYPDYVECSWLIRASNNDHVLIKIEESSSTQNLPCSNNTLDIFDGPNRYAETLARFCGGNASDANEFITSSSEAFLHFQTIGNLTGSRFNLTYQRVDPIYLACHRGPLELQASEGYGTINLDQNSNIYPNNARCEWLVESTLDMVQFQVSHFDFPQSTNESHILNNLTEIETGRCTGNVIEIFDGASDKAELLATTCNQDPFRQYQYLSTSKTVLIRFTAHGSVSSIHLSFRALTKGHEACMGEPLELTATTSPQNITSPNYPRNYDNNARCKWRITSSASYHLQISFVAFNLEGPSSCVYDSLEFFEGPDSGSYNLAKLCGQHYNQRRLLSTSNTTLVYFHTDGSVTKSGFSLVYQLIDRDRVIPACQGNSLIHLQANTSQQSIESPNYNNNPFCRWRIDAPTGGLFLNVEYWSSQRYCSESNYLSITTDNLGWNSRIAQLCSSSVRRYVSNSSKTTIEFRSGNRDLNSGFRLTFQAVPENYFACHRGVPQTLYATFEPQSILSPGYPEAYPDEIECAWRIGAPNNDRVLIKVEGNLLTQNLLCMNNTLDIFDGPNQYAETLARFCGGNASDANEFITSSNDAFLHFQTIGNLTGGRFNLTYQRVDPIYLACHRGPLELQASESYEFIRFQENAHVYPNIIRCEWRIESTLDIVQINISQIYLHQSTNESRILDNLTETETGCSRNVIEIFDGASDEAELLATICGQDPFRRSVHNTSTSKTVLIRFTADGPTSQIQFNLRFRGLTKVYDACMGEPLELTATTSLQSITSPNYPQYYNNNPFCRWRINAPTGGLFMDVEYQSPRRYCYGSDYLLITADNLVRNHRIARLCSSRVYTYVSNSSTTMIELRSDNRFTNNGFRLTFQAVPENYFACHRGVPQTLYATFEPQSIQSPGYPEAYLDEIECAWRIGAPNNDHVLIKVEDNGLTQNPLCMNNTLNIFDGRNRYAEILARFCGGNASDANEFITSSNDAFLHFKTIGNLTGGRFNLTYQRVDPIYLACHRGPLELQASESYEFISFQENAHVYPNITRCEWRIESTLDMVQININQIYFHQSTNESRILDNLTETETGCPRNVIEIFDGASDEAELLTTTCGQDPFRQYQYISPSKTVFIRFTADSPTSYFELSFRGLPKGYEACTGEPLELTATTSPQSITSPYYPRNYNNDAQCKWQITSSLSYYLQISFVEFNLEYHPRCNYDSLEVFEGPDSSSYHLAKLCGQSLTDRGLLSTSNTTLVYFHTDGSDTRSGFSLVYQLIDRDSVIPACSGRPMRLEATTTPQTLESPGYPNAYENNTLCQWHIESSLDVVNINIEELLIHNDSSCDDVAMEIYDGEYIHSPRLAMLCGSSSSVLNYFSLSKTVLIRLRSNITHGSAGFRLTYQSVEKSHAACTNRAQDLRASFIPRAIESPGYPNDYPNNASCAWRIVVESGIINLQVYNLMLEGGADCANDALEIFDGANSSANSLAILCGQNISQSLYFSSSSALYIQFRSDGSTTNPGFNLTYMNIPEAYQGCFGSILELQATPNMTSFAWHNELLMDINSTLTCGLRIISEGSIRFYFDGISNGNVVFPVCDGPLEIFDGASEHSTRLASYCGYHSYNGTSYKSSSGVVYLQVQFQRNYVGFQLNFHRIMPYQACQASPVVLQASYNQTDSIESPGYSVAYPANVDCRWRIEAANGTIHIQLYNLRLQNSSNCVADSLEIFNGPDENAPRMYNLCGQGDMLTLYTSSNRIFVRFRTDSDDNRKGFYLTYTVY